MRKLWGGMEKSCILSKLNPCICSGIGEERELSAVKLELLGLKILEQIELLPNFAHCGPVDRLWQVRVDSMDLSFIRRMCIVSCPGRSVGSHRTGNFTQHRTHTFQSSASCKWLGFGGVKLHLAA